MLYKNMSWWRVFDIFLRRRLRWVTLVKQQAGTFYKMFELKTQKNKANDAKERLAKNYDTFTY